MIIAVILTVILAILIFYLAKAWYSQISNDYPSNGGGITPGEFEDWTGTLNIDSHRTAIQEYCNVKGYGYEVPLSPTGYGSCLYTKETCEADSNPHYVTCSRSQTGPSGPTGPFTDPDGKACDPNQHPYLEWHVDKDGIGRCHTSPFPPAFIQKVCEAKGLGEWYQGTPICDSSGYCQLNPDDAPTCRIKSEYCDSMGMDFESDKGLGNCDISDVQNVFEGIFGKTITRTFKRNTEAMIHECSDSPFSANCAKSIGTELTTLDQIALNLADKEFDGYMTDLKKSCSGDIYSSTDNFAKCAESLLPGMYLTEQVVQFADNMLNGALGWIPGIPSGLLQKGAGYIYKYGKVALTALYHAGEDAIKAFDIAGDAMYYALNKIPVIGPIVGAIVNGAVKGVIKFGKDMAGIIANVAQDAIHIFANDIVPEVYHVFHAVVNAVLHPIEFFKSVGNDINKFITDPIGSMKAAFDVVKSLGTKVGKIVGRVLKYLKGILSDVPGLGPIIDYISNIFSGVLDDLESAGKAVAGFFSSIF